jgi:hypothetical protein
MLKTLITAAALAAATPALADELFFHGADGSYQGSAEVLSNGDTFFHGADGSYQGSATRLGNGDTFYHGADGGYLGSSVHLGGD